MNQLSDSSQENFIKQLEKCFLKLKLIVIKK